MKTRDPTDVATVSLDALSEAIKRRLEDMENCEHHFLELVSRFFYEGNSVFPSSFSGLFVSYPIFSVRAETLKGARFA